MPGGGQTINPTGRVLSLQTPFELNGSILGNLLITIDAEDSISFESEALMGFLRDRVSGELIERLQDLSERDVITIDALTSVDINTDFDMGSLTITMQIPTKLLVQRTLKIRGGSGRSEDLADPSGVSGYLNFRSLLSRSSSADVVSTELVGVLDSEIRLGGPALAFAIALADDEDQADRVSVTRQYTRLVIDSPNRESRMTFGDIDIRSGRLLASPQLIGFSIERDYDLSPSRIVKPTGQRQFSLARPSKVTLVTNGRKQRTFDLDAGNYNVSDIPLAEGYNNLLLQVEDDTGQIEEFDFSTLFTSELLAKGEIDYAFSVGWLATSGGGSPNYLRDELAMGGFIRYGALDTLTLGHSLQLSDSLAIVDTEGVQATRFGPWSAAVGLSLPRNQEVGWAVSTEFTNTTSLGVAEVSWNAGFEISSSEYQRSLRAAAEPIEADDDTLSAFFGIAAALPGQRQFSGEAVHIRQNGVERNVVNAALSGNLSLGRGVFWALRFRHEKSSTDFSSASHTESNNVTFALNYQFDRAHQFSSLLSSDGPLAELSASRQIKSGLVGGYNLGFVSSFEADRERDTELFLGYTGNRFEAQLNHSVRRQLDENSESSSSAARLSTSLVFADGAIALSRPVSDSFAIIGTHATLGDRTLRLSPGNDSEIARSDWLGPAVVPDLGLFNTRPINYNVDDLPLGYDLGAGVFFVAPPRAGGYQLEVGSAAVITVIGTLVDELGGESINLTSGTATSVLDTSSEPVLFFTNRAGKFALSGVAPGDYTVELYSDPVRSFTLTIPSDGTTLYRAGTITVP